MEKKECIHNRSRLKWRWKGFRRYLYKMIISNVILVLLPICILGIFWFHMVSSQAEQKFHQQKSIEMNEMTAGINQRIKTIKIEVALEKRDNKYITYTDSDEYTTELSVISKRLSAMAEKYYILQSVYFYDKTTGRIYNSNTGSYYINSFYDTSWLKEIKESYIIQQLPLRNVIEEGTIFSKNTLYNQYNKLVLSLVIKGKPEFYLVANISILKLYNDIAINYEINKDNQEFFFLNKKGQLIEGECKYTAPESLLINAELNEDMVSYHVQDDRVYYIKPIDYDIICVTSYPSKNINIETQYFVKYIVIVCIGLFVFLLFISFYMAKKLYKPINTLYSDIAESTRNLQNKNAYDEIDMLKLIFVEMNTFNSDAKRNLKQLNEISKTINFRNYLERCQFKKDFLQDHPNLFDEEGNGFCEMLLLKIDVTDLGMSIDEEILYRLNLQEVLSTYLQPLKGIVTKAESDNLVLLYQKNQTDKDDQIRKKLTDAVIKLTNSNTYCASSKLIKNADQVITSYHECLEVLEASYFFNWRNEIITQERFEKIRNTDDIYDIILNINTSFVRSIVSQDETEINNLFKQLECTLLTILNVSQNIDICSRIMVELDHEFQFSKNLDTNLIKALNENKTMMDLLAFMKTILIQLFSQYKNNDTKENHYCELAKKYLDENYVRDMNITDVADSLDVSYSYLSKIFKSKTDMTLTDYLNNARIQKSKEYLETSFLNLYEISEKVGYNNVQSYQRFFKKYTNLTPGDYRKLHTIS